MPLLIWVSVLDMMLTQVNFNKRACAFILFWNLMSPCTALFEPARLIIQKETILPARLLEHAPFWILLLVLSKKKVKSAEIATKMLQ